jgi:hypothetical protein
MSWTDSTLFLRMLVVAFRTFLWPSYQVSDRTWYKHVAPSTHPLHDTTEGQTRLHCRSTHSRLSQAANCSSGMWRHEMLPSILHGCHFDTISSFFLKKLSRIFLIRPRILFRPVWSGNWTQNSHTHQRTGKGAVNRSNLTQSHFSRVATHRQGHFWPIQNIFKTRC